MSEAMIQAGPIVETQVAQPDPTLWDKIPGSAKVAAGVSAFALAVAGCGVTTETRTITTEASPTDVAAATTSCGEPLDLSANRADIVFGSQEALFPTLKTVDQTGHDTLLPTDKAIAKVKEQLTHDSRVLAIWTAFVTEPRDNKQIPTAATINRANELQSSYEVNQALASQDAAKACAEADYLTPTTDFSVLKGQGEDIIADRTSGHITDIRVERINTIENLTGFKVGYLRDISRNKLTPEDRALLDKLESLFVLDKDGVPTLNIWTGSGSFKVANTHDAMRVRVIKDKNGKQVIIPATPRRSNGSVPAGTTQTQSQSGGGSRSTSQARGNNTGSQTSGTTIANMGGGTGQRAPAVKPGNTSENQSGPLTGTQTGPSGPGNVGAHPAPGQTPQGGGGGNTAGNTLTTGGNSTTGGNTTTGGVSTTGGNTTTTGGETTTGSTTGDTTGSTTGNTTGSTTGTTTGSSNKTGNNTPGATGGSDPGTQGIGDPFGG